MDPGICCADAGYGTISRRATLHYSTKTGIMNVTFRKSDVKLKSPRFLRDRMLRLSGKTKTRIGGKLQCFVAHIKVCR